MMDDSIVEEIHQIRARLLEESGGDLDKLLDRYQSMEEQERERLVTLEEVRQRQARSNAPRQASS